MSSNKEVVGHSIREDLVEKLMDLKIHYEMWAELYNGTSLFHDDEACCFMLRAMVTNKIGGAGGVYIGYIYDKLESFFEDKTILVLGLDARDHTFPGEFKKVMDETRRELVKMREKVDEIQQERKMEIIEINRKKRKDYLTQLLEKYIMLEEIYCGLVESSSLKNVNGKYKSYPEPFDVSRDRLVGSPRTGKICNHLEATGSHHIKLNGLDTIFCPVKLSVRSRLSHQNQDTETKIRTHMINLIRFIGHTSAIEGLFPKCLMLLPSYGGVTIVYEENTRVDFNDVKHLVNIKKNIIPFMYIIIRQIHFLEQHNVIVRNLAKAIRLYSNEYRLGLIYDCTINGQEMAEYENDVDYGVYFSYNVKEGVSMLETFAMLLVHICMYRGGRIIGGSDSVQGILDIMERDDMEKEYADCGYKKVHEVVLAICKKVPIEEVIRILERQDLPGYPGSPSHPIELVSYLETYPNDGVQHVTDEEEEKYSKDKEVNEAIKKIADLHKMIDDRKYQKILMDEIKKVNLTLFTNHVTSRSFSPEIIGCLKYILNTSFGVEDGG